MNFFTLVAANIRFSPSHAFFNILLLAIGIATILILSQIDRRIDESFSRDLRGIDLVVSGKGSPLQIILSSVFHIDIPTGNIPASQANEISKNPLVKMSIPLALGDNFNGFRIVGTNPAYISHYQGEIVEGKIYKAAMEVVVGSEVAHTYHLKVGDKIVGAHGLVGSDDLHTDNPYTVVGILAPANSVLDRLVLTPVESVWRVHENEKTEDDGPAHHHNVIDHREKFNDREYTALLLTYKSPLAAAQLPRQINKIGTLQAASPAFEIARLNRITGVATNIFSIFGWVLMALAILGFFLSLSAAINDRLPDLVLMRVLGVNRVRLSMHIAGEALLLGSIGTVLGLVFAKFFSDALTAYIRITQHIFVGTFDLSKADLFVLCGGLAVSLLAAILPAIRAYRISLVSSLKRS